MPDFVDLDNTGIVKITAKRSKVVAEFEARGGVIKSQEGGALPMDPTPAGEYLIAWRQTHVSQIWLYSKIAWGTPFRLNAKGDAEVKINEKWIGTTSIDPDLTTEAILSTYNRYRAKVDDTLPELTKETLPRSWRLNDFGPIAVLMYQDNDHDRKFNAKKDKIRQEMFHTTPINHFQEEFGKEVVLDDSHGCIHIKPADMKKMLDSGYFSKNNTVIVHSYDESSPNYRVVSGGKPPYTLHFYPGQLKLLVYGN